MKHTDLDFIAPRRYAVTGHAYHFPGSRFQCDVGDGRNTSQTSSQTTNSYDNRIGVEGDGAIIFSNATMGDLTINSLDAEVAQGALSASVQFANAALQAVGTVTQGSNQIAAAVVSSQRDFVESASGQKTTQIAIGIAAAAAVAMVLFSSSKSK